MTQKGLIHGQPLKGRRRKRHVAQVAWTPTDVPAVNRQPAARVDRSSVAQAVSRLPVRHLCHCRLQLCLSSGCIRVLQPATAGTLGVLLQTTAILARRLHAPCPATGAHERGDKALTRRHAARMPQDYGQGPLGQASSVHPTRLRCHENGAPFYASSRHPTRSRRAPLPAAARPGHPSRKTD